jgi:hypothetical protein
VELEGRSIFNYASSKIEEQRINERNNGLHRSRRGEDNFLLLQGNETNSSIFWRRVVGHGAAGELFRVQGGSCAERLADLMVFRICHLAGTSGWGY